MSPPDRLYGVEGAEVLCQDIGDVIDEIKSNEDPADGPWTITEWTVRPPIDGVPTAEWIVDLIVEATAANGEFTEDPFNGADLSKDPVLLTLAESMRAAVASKITWHMADKPVGSYTLSIDGDAESWLLNNEPPTGATS